MRGALIWAVIAAVSFTAGAFVVSRKVFPYTLWLELRPYDDGMATYRRERAAFFDHFSAPADVVVVGDSIIADLDWREVMPDTSIANRGIRGDTTQDVLARIPGILAPKPERVVLIVGVNDLDNGDSPKVVAERYRQIVDRLSPQTEVIAVSTLPCGTANPHCDELVPQISELNELIALIPNATFVDVRGHLGDGQLMEPSLTYDGTHLNVAGFEALVAGLKPYLGDAPYQTATKN